MTQETSPDTQAHDPLSAPPPQNRPGGSRKRLLGLLAVLTVVAALYPFASARIRAWRRQQAERTESLSSGPAVAPPALESDPESGSELAAGSEPDRQSASAGYSASTASGAAVPDQPPQFADLPEDGERRIHFLREEALQTARQLRADLPQQPRAVVLLALTHGRFGQTDEAERCWRECLELKADLAEAHAGLGSLAQDRGDYEAAVQHFREALRLNPQLPDLRASLADALTAQSQFREAAELLEADVRQFPKSTGSWYRLGQAYLQLGQYERAVKNYEAAIRIDPQCTYAYYGLATACRHLGQQEQSAKHTQKFKELKRKDLGGQRERNQRFDDEGEVRRTAAFSHAAAGRVYADHGAWAQAEAHWQRAVLLDPKDVLARTDLVQLYERRQRIADALRLLEELREIEPKNPLHAVRLGSLQLRANDVAAAERSFLAAVEIAPQDPVGYVALADFHLRTGCDLAAARKLAEQAVSQAPVAPNYALLATVCQRQNDLPAAVAAVDRALALAPRHAGLQQLRAQLRARLPGQRRQKE